MKPTGDPIRPKRLIGLLGVLCFASAAQAGDTYTYAAPIPFISALQPSSGPSGTIVMILGSNFTGATSVTFGATAATTFNVLNANAIAAQAPSGTGTVQVTVTTPAGVSQSPN